MGPTSWITFSSCLLFTVAAHATEPGTPTDCSDLEVAPGLTCTALSPPGSGTFDLRSTGLVDNEGRVLDVGDGSVRDRVEPIGTCGTTDLYRQGLLFHNQFDGSRIPLITFRVRCLDAALERLEGVRFNGLVFDAVRGRVLVPANSNCGSSRGQPCPEYNSQRWTAAIDGFTPLADVLQTPPPLCANGIDDDEDGDIDLEDAHCKSEADNDESRP